MGLPMKKRRLHLELSSNSNADWDLQQQQQSSKSKIECTSNAPQSSAAGIDMLLSAATLTRPRRVSHTLEDMDTSPSSAPSSPSLLRRGSAASAEPVQQLHAPRTAQVVTCGVCNDTNTTTSSVSVSSLYQKMMTDRLSKANVVSDQSSHLLLSSINSIMMPPSKTSVSQQSSQTYNTKKRARVDRDTKVTSPYLISECSSINSEEDTTNTVSSSSYAGDISNQIQLYAYNELMRRHKQKMQYLLEQRNQTMLMLTF
jgi:hypothetical protein